MTNNGSLTGILAAMATPFTQDGREIDEGALVALTDRLVRAKVSGLVPCGSTGEFASLTVEERCRVTEVVLEAAAGRVAVAPHTGAITTSETIALSRHAEAAGAAAVMVVPPFYDQPGFADLVAHYAAVAEAVNIPLMLYHNPPGHGYRLSATEIKAILAIEGVNYLKDSSGDLATQEAVQQAFPDKVQVFCGQDTVVLAGLAAGASGAVWGAANFVPEPCVELFDLIYRQDLAGARALWKRLWPVCSFLETEGYVASVKAGCALVGQPVGPPRLPIRPLSPDATRRLANLIASTGTGTNSTDGAADRERLSGSAAP